MPAFFPVDLGMPLIFTDFPKCMWLRPSSSWMKGSPCCAGLMRSCLHTYRTKTNLTQHIIQPWGAISQVWGGHQSSMGGPSTNYGGAISQVSGGHQSSMGGHRPSMGGSSTNYGGGGHQPSMGESSTNHGGAISQVWGGGIFPPVCTGSQNPENYFSNTYVLPSVNRTAGPKIYEYQSHP